MMQAVRVEVITKLRPNQEASSKAPCMVSQVCAN